jgi:diguanylate cyclase (GGDEF)-like protein
MSIGRVPALAQIARPESTAGTMILNAAIVGAVVLVASLFGNYTRPVGHLSAFWPANALFLGMMVRNPRLVTPLGVFAAAAGYMAGDLIAGGSLRMTLLLTAANLTGAGAGYLVFSRLVVDDQRLRRPVSVIYLVLAACFASAMAAMVGAVIHPVLFDGSMLDGWIFWFVSELVNYVALLPVVLTVPDFHWLKASRRRSEPQPIQLGKIMPVAALVLSAVVGLVVGGPGAVAFPVPALLWCALTGSLFMTAVLTLTFSVWTLLAISMGLLHLSFDNNDWHTLMSIRMGVTLMALAPITVGSVMAARNELLQRLQHMAAHDQLTGLLNRNAFRERSTVLLARLGVERRPAAVLMIDIDRFKTINDSHGHAAGDQVLAGFARLAGGYLRDTDAFGRLGGEEFAILLADCFREEAQAIAERIRLAFEEAAIDIGEDRQISATLSVGFASTSHAPADLDTLLLAADKALYRAKKTGRNRIETDEPDTSEAGKAG